MVSGTGRSDTTKVLLKMLIKTTVELRVYATGNLSKTDQHQYASGLGSTR